MKIFTEDELRQFDGRNGLIYIAYCGKVYDVSASYHWRRGVHHAMHSCGCDLTSALQQAPHGIELLEKFPVVGYLGGNSEECTRRELV